MKTPPVRFKRILAIVLAAGFVLSASPAAAQPQVQALPSPARFVSNLDLECFQTTPYTPPPTSIFTRHLNPVLADLPSETVQLGPREKLCVPVAKNNVLPPPDVIDFIRFVDLSCYRIEGINVNRPLTLRHLNPLFSTSTPPRNVVITEPQHLCLPVIKNGVVPPPEVLRLVRHIDLKCYREQPQSSMNRNLSLTQLNPVLAHLPTHGANITFNRQLCVPVAKSATPPPADVLNIVRWVDLEIFSLTVPAALPPVNLTLKHINPLLSHLPEETATISPAFQLGLPVRKNNAIPPN